MLANNDCVILCQPLWQVSGFLFFWVFFFFLDFPLSFLHFISHLLLAWERVVVTRHISHDGLLVWPQGANDICPVNRGRGQRGENARVKECRDKRASRRRNHKRRQQWDTSHLQSTHKFVCLSLNNIRITVIFMWEVSGQSENILFLHLFFQIN